MASSFGLKREGSGVKGIKMMLWQLLHIGGENTNKVLLFIIYPA